MLIDLDGPIIVSSFKQALATFTFIPKPKIRDIRTQLDILSRDRIRNVRTTRAQRTEAAIWLWDCFFYNALSSITANTRGYPRLSEYFRQYAHYENVLFSIDENHRDHVIHSIWVMMIGLYLTKQCRPLASIYYPVFQPVKDFKKTPSTMHKAFDILCSNEDALWVLTSLTHDLGYPIQKTTIANDVMSAMISNFGFLQQTKFSYQFTVLHQPAIDELLNIISTTVHWFEDGHYKLGIDSGLRLDYSKSLELLDHGIMSAYLIQRYLDFICEIMSYYRDCPEYIEDDSQTAAFIGLIVLWLSAISDHTNCNKYFTELYDISVLLIISDELDEFSRYSHARNTDTWIRIKCKPSINCTSHSLDFVYNFQDRTRDETIDFFKGKVSRLIDCFELQEYSIRKISIKCSNSSQSQGQNNVSYYFERRFDTGDGFVKKFRRQPNTNVRGFLREM